MRTRLPTIAPLTLAFSALALGIAFELLRAMTGLGGRSLDSLTTNWVYMAIELIAIGVCAARSFRHRDHRRAWALMTVALVCWSTGDLLWAVWLDDVARPPFPSPADGLYLLMYPAMYAALMQLMRSQLRHAAASQWLDGAVVALAVAAVAAALVFSDVLATSNGRFVAEAVTVAYPVGDFILLMFVALAYTVAGWRPGRDWLTLGGGVVLMAIADIIDVDRVAGGLYVDSAPLNVLYLLAFSLLAVAAWAPPRSRSQRVREDPHTITLTFAAAAVALGLLIVAAFTRITPLAIGLAAGCLVAAAGRSALTYLENAALLRARSHEAVTDSLTGLPNRRRLTTDLDEVIGERSGTASLVFFDLNGFKLYNDTFGHLVGDALLARLASALQRVVGGHGCAYRLGGDEFCLLLDGSYPRHHQLIAAAASALSDHGRGFDVAPAFGVAIIPDEAVTARAALRLADERMYADKGRSHRAPTRDVLMQLLNERTPGLLDHVSGVTTLTGAVAGRMRLDAEKLDETLRAAELHDIGKLAIPDEILEKPGPLTPDEWEFMKQHSVIGERILGVAPALVPVARLVRASHERWDGGGYPDGLAEDDIPLGARIVAVCDAYDAMVSERCYQRALTTHEALAELQRNAGTQFDPDVVDAIRAHLDAADVLPRPIARFVED